VGLFSMTANDQQVFQPEQKSLAHSSLPDDRKTALGKVFPGVPYPITLLALTRLGVAG